MTAPQIFPRTIKLINKHYLLVVKMVFKILCVDDEGYLLHAYRRILSVHAEGSPESLEVVTAENGVHGLELFAQDPTGYKLIITDREMPKMDGFSLLQELCQKYSRLPPRLMISGGADNNDYAEARRCGAIGLVTKPIELRTLKTIVVELTQNNGKSPELWKRLLAKGYERPRRILIADDEAAITSLEAELLHYFGEVVTVKNGAEAFEHYKQYQSSGGFDLILTDYIMPGMNGVELITAVRGYEQSTGSVKDKAPVDKTKVPIILLSGTGNGINQQAVDAGVTGIISKPIDMDILESAAWELLDTYTLQQNGGKSPTLEKSNG